MGSIKTANVEYLKQLLEIMDAGGLESLKVGEIELNKARKPEPVPPDLLDDGTTGDMLPEPDVGYFLGTERRQGGLGG